ncbi:MAG: tetratricopeptide repeat protein [Chitinivibrionales bacterium]|nr:tetratricopeptide repeat protein [Chitinivibrionales bacterium]MBD3357622.1 tetratricopeptide repeat protein [Chitinivibrionales bacterium]
MNNSRFQILLERNRMKKNMRGCLSAMLLLCVGLFSGDVAAQSIESLMNSGNMLLQNGAYDQAVTKYRKVLGRDPGNFEAQFNLGFAYLNWGRNSNAVTEFKKALGINPNCAECWSNLAMAFENLGQTDDALSALYKAVDANPGSIAARLNLATMYANNDRLDEAVRQYKEVVRIDGRNVDAHLNLAKCLISNGSAQEARQYLKATLAINPQEAEAFWELGNIAWKKDGNTDEALAMYRKAISLKPTSQVYYENLGLLLEELRRNEEALEVWKKYLVYLDDALKKEKIHYRIQILERGESPSGNETPEELFGEADEGKEINRLREELGRDAHENRPSPKLITTESMDVGGELEAMEEEDENSFDLDMKKALRKKKREKE